MSELLFADAGRAALRRGIDAVADAAGVTLGPRGRRVVIGTAQGPVVTGDGATVAETVQLADLHADLGAAMVRQAAARTRRTTGDGTTTTIVLTQALVTAGLRAVVAGAGPPGVRRGIDAAVSAVVEDLAGKAQPLDGERDTARVAQAAAREPEAAELIALAFSKAGRDAAVSVEEAHVPGVQLEFTEGLRLDQGLLSPFMVTHPEQGKAVLEDACVLLHHGRIEAPGDLLPVMEKVAATGRPLLVVADSLQQDALAALVSNRLRGTLLCAAVTAPALGGRRLAHLEDLAALTGGEVVSPQKGMLLRRAGLDTLGRAARVVVTRDTTTVTGGSGSADALGRRIAHVRHALDRARTDDHETLRLRLARLTGGVCVLRVGGSTDPDRAERAQRINGAVAAVRAALTEGVVPGGGMALLRSTRLLDDGLGLIGDERAGALAVRASLSAPLRRLAHNAGEDGAHIAGAAATHPDGHGWDAATGTFRDLHAAGIVDPLTITRTALQNAASVSGLLLTAEALVVDRAARDPDSVSWRRRDHHHAHGHRH